MASVRKTKSKPKKQAKTLLVGHADDAELLRYNVAHHFAVGFAKVVVVTAGKDDAAASVVAEFDPSKAFHYVVDEMGGDPFDLFAGPVRWALAKFATPWLALCDTDEFIVSRSGSVRRTPAKDTYDFVAIPRYTVLPTRDSDGALLPLDLSRPETLPIAAEIFDVKSAWLTGDRSVPYVRAQDAPKVLARTSFIDGIVPGGHGVITRRAFLTRCVDEDLAIVHVPFTTLPRFARKVAQIRDVLARFADRLGPEDAWHWRAWAALDEVGIAAEFEAQIRPSAAEDVATIERLFAMPHRALVPASHVSFSMLKTMVRYLEPIEQRAIPQWVDVDFDAAWYVQRYEDVRMAIEREETSPLAHFLTIGIVEGRSPSVTFDPHYVREELERYSGNYVDLRDVYWLYGSLPAGDRSATMRPAVSAGEELLRYYDTRLAEHGDNARGADWRNEAERDLRFDVLLDVARSVSGEASFSLCDYACGTGELLRRIRQRGLTGITYAGVDASQTALAFARAKYSDVSFTYVDPEGGEKVPDFACDVAIANGLFTVRADLSDGEMWVFMTTTLQRLWRSARRGIAFNVMSPIVDWKRDDLFHVSYDAMASFLHELAGRRIGFRADYGLYEYVAYATKAPK